VTLSYGVNGTLIGVAFDREISQEQFEAVSGSIYFHEGDLLQAFKKFPHLIFTIPDDLSFDTFWDAYKLKRNRKRAEKHWDKMNIAQRTAALAYIPRYIYSVKKTGIAQKYPDTFLLNESWTDQ